MTRLATTLLPLAILLTGCIDFGVTPIPPKVDPPKEDEETDPDPDEVDEPKYPEGTLVGGVQGRICAPSQHQYVADAKVSIEHEYGVDYTFTDADGYFVLDDIPTGTYRAVVQKGSFRTFFDVFIPPNEVIELAEEECLVDDLNVAVVSGEYDHIQHILSQLGIDFDMYNGMNQQGRDLLLSPETMEQYDIIFFNCGMTYDYMMNDFSAVSNNLREYVRGGGSVYTSDWAYFLVENAYPNMVDFRGNDAELWAPARGVAGDYSADVLDPSMQVALGGAATAAIRYDLDVWITPVGAGAGTNTMVYGRYRYYTEDLIGEQTGEGPLAIRMEDGGGAVLFTTFHNEAQITLDMDKLLQEIIWAL